MTPIWALMFGVVFGVGHEAFVSWLCSVGRAGIGLDGTRRRLRPDPTPPGTGWSRCQTAGARQLLPAPWAVHFRPLARPMRPASERLRREGPAESGSVVSGVAIAVALTEGSDFFAEPVNGA